MSEDICNCPFCGSKIRSELVKQLRATGINLSAADFQIIQKMEQLQARVFNVEQKVKYDGRIGGNDVSLE